MYRGWGEWLGCHNSLNYVHTFVYRNHLNDLENIPAFIFVGFFYLLIQPAAWTAIWHFRVFTVSRVLHTICYQMPIPQPSRALCQLVGFITTVSMAVQVTVYAISVIF